MAFELTCYEGMNEITLSERDLPGLGDDTTIKELRDLLIKKQFFKPGEEYKFARAQVSHEPAANPEDLINLSLYAYADEADISIKRLYTNSDKKSGQIANSTNSDKKRVQIANITHMKDLNKKPDYVGEYTTEWRRQVGMQNGSPKSIAVKVESVKEGNFQPIMLSNVIRTNNGVDCFEYACICEENSVVRFMMGGAGACGNEYKVDIVGANQSLGAFGNISNFDEGAYKFKWGCFDRWYGTQNYGQEIKIISTDAMTGIDPVTKLQYRIINFHVNEITKWYSKDKNGNITGTFTVNDYRKILPKPANRPNVKTAVKTKMSARASQVTSVGGTINNGANYIYNPNDVSDASLGGGDKRGVNWSKDRCYDSATTPYGVISAHFFIFKDATTAEAYFRRYFG